MSNKNTDWRAKYRAMMTDPDYAEKMASAVDDTRKVNTNLMNKSEEFGNSLSLDKPTGKPLDLSRVQKMQAEQAARATMPDDDSGVADLAVQAYADARKQIGDEVSKQMADDKSMAFVHPMAAGLLRSAESMKAGDVQKTFDRMLENNAVRQAIETKANKELTAALGENPALTDEQQKDIYNKSVQRQIDAISGRVNQYLLGVNAPKSEGEYVLKSAVGNSLIGKSMLQAARNISGLESAEYDYGQQALADYDANKASWYGKGGAAIGGLLLDAPMMQGIGSASSAVLGRGTSMALGKAASNTLWGKMLIGQATAAGTLGGYNFTSTLASQMMGGRFDAGELFGSTLHGVGLGAATGGMTPLLRGATAGMGAVGKTATMGGGILGEAAAFSAPEWVETFNENPYDFKAYAEALGTNVMVIAGLKASNLPKTVQEYKEWWNQGKTSGFTDADYKALSDYALAKGYANDGAFTYQDGVYQRSMADRATGGRNILTMTKLEGGKERNLAMEMYQDPNVPLSMKTKIAAKMGLPAPNPVLPNAVEARDNVVNTYYEYREQMSDGTYVTRRILVDSKEMPSKRKARAAASEFGRTKARQNSIIQSEAEANTDATNAIVMARLTEQAWRSGTNVSDEVARMYDIAQRAQRGEASAEDIAYYQSVMEGTTEVTDRIKADIKAKTGVDIDEVLKQEGTFNTAQDKALTMYGEALASLKDNSKPTTERGTTASQASIADYIELKGMGIEQTKQLLNDPTSKVAAEKEIRSKYNLWLKYFDGQMSEEQLATRLGYNLDSTKGLMDFVNEEAFFRGKAANRIAYNASNTAKRLLEQGSGGVRFTEDGKVKLQGVPYSIAVDESIVDRYRAAQQGSGENYQRIANDALKDIIRQSEQPIEEMLQQMATDEQAIANEPQTEQEAVTQQMVDNRLAEIDTDLQGIEADGVQRVSINDKPAMIVKGRIATLGNGEIDRAKSSTEVAYIPLDENGRPIKNEQGKPVVEVGVKPSNVRISEVEQWRTIEDYKRAEEQRIRDNNRITDEAIAQVGAEDTEVKEELPTLDKVVVEPKDADELVAMCDGDKGLALDVAVDELAKAQAAKGKGASTAETIDINRRIRTYQQIVDRLSASEMPDAAADVESEQKGEQAKAEPQVTDDMEFIYQQGLDENHEGMEPMQTSDGRYKWVGLQRGELTATMGERDVELLDGLAKKLGVAVIPINVTDSAVNGYYRDGNVYVNTNRGADWTMRWVAGHELLHDVAKKSPEAYDAYKQAVLDMWGSDYIDGQVKQIIDDYAASGKTIDREQALTELVNDFGGELFNSRDGLNILDNILKDESRKGNTGFVNTIKQWWERLKEWFGVTPYANEVEKKLADAYKSAMKVMADRMGKRKVVEQQELATIGGLKDEAVADDAISNEGAEMSIVRDRNKIEELEGEELVPMLRTFQILDGALYSPMATIQRGKKVHSVVEGDWWKSDENPDLAKVKVKGKKDEFYDKDDDRISKKDGKWVITIDGEDKPLATNGNSLSYYFNLKKGEKGDVVTDDLDVSYNPYIHSSKSALNDQFKGAYLRPNLALVEVLVPKSELDGTNRYKADYAKDGIGEVDWNSGTVIKQAVAAGHPGRKVALSRYAKIGKVFTDAEWADKIDEELSAYKGQITLPFIAFPPDVLRELANRGYKVKPPTSKKAQPYYEKWLNGEQPTDPNGGKPNTEFSIKADKQKQFGIISSINPMRDDYHTGIRKVDDILTLQEAIEASKQENGEGIISTYPDVDESVYNEALQSGKIKVYSSKPIENGAFVGPSMMQAKDYAGGGKVYSKEVNVSDIAWINADEGVYASLGKRADESVLDYAKRMSEETGKKNLLNGGSYFSGGGLLEEGLKGIVNPTIAVEFNQKVAGVYRNNFGEHIVTADVRNVDPASLVKNIDGPVAYFHASPVCKNFSKAKQSAEELPLDKATAQSTAEFISKVRPKIVTIENVKGYRDSESMKIILGELKKQGYNYDVDVYNAADYGAYTSRERLIVRAVRDWSLPAKPMVMLADDRPSGWLEAVADIIDTLPEKKGGVAKWMDERLMAMGIDYRNIDKPLYVFGSGYSKDRIGYAFADELVPTLRTKGGDVIVMPDGRVLKATPRVLARISGMSDEYEMPKTDDLAHTIVGNGIPVQLTKAVMGSLIENVKSDLDAGNTEYSIIGKRGAANLDKRDETSIRVGNMVTAEEMEKAGKDAKTIRMATGWERGADGKWRYEVKDLSMLPAEQWIGKRNKKLSDIVENADELFAAYPELANVKIKEGNGKTYGGSYSSGVITLDTYLAKLWMKRLPDSLPRANKYMNEALIHEIQHYIQGEEGFARGGNESMVLDKGAVSKISALIDDSNKLATQYNNMIESGVYEGREAVKDEIIALRAKANAIRNSNRLGYDGYKRLAGEVEARNAEKRLGMTEEERKKSLLADTEDVGRDEQIVYGNTDDEYSIKIRGKEYRNDGYTQREGVNLSIGANEALKSGMTDIGMDGLFGDFIAESGLGKFDGEYHHVGQKFNKHYFAKLNDGVTLASARKAYKKYLEDKSNKEVSDVLKKYPDAIPMDGGIYRDYKEVAYAGGKFWFVPRGENEPRPTFYKDLPNGEDADYTTYFSVKANNELDKKSLVGIHNLTEDNLRYALNLGGLANPSTAVINKDIMGLEGFGDISLIMPKSLVAKSSGKNAGTFAGDAYTPRFPRGSVVKYMTKDGEKAVAKDYPGKDKFSQDFRSAIYSLGDEYGGVTPTLYYMYKLENGGADIIKTKAPEFKSDKHKRMVEEFGQKEWYELSDAEKQELFDFRKEEMQEMLKNADKGLVSKRMSNFANYPVDDVAHDKLRTLQREYKKLQNAGEIDYAATYRNAQDDVALTGEQADFNKWLSQISAKYGIEDRIFRGYTPSGNRKYAPLTLANLSKIMKEQGRAGEESFMSKSVYSLRAKMLPAFKTLESIRKNKDKITDEGTYNKRREEISSEYNDLIFEIVKLPNVEYDDAHYVLEDALTKGFAYAEKTANTKFDDAVKARIQAFGKLLAEAPSKYFETKFERPVMFNEFVAAVVPKDINPELRKALTDNGLAVEEYDRGDEASRLEAIRKASDRDDVQFSIKGGNTPKKQADEVARLKQKIEQLSQEKDAIAEDGAKVKDIASEMTNFIKQNISTEIQSDMTRNQFKGILNQLENAVTKKDLEKPMQMIEHIGTNVTRRSLTRQMRNFLKSEFKSMTPQGAVKAKTVDGATSRVLELAKTMYATMNKLPLGGEVAALQKQMRDLKADATEWATDQSADTKNLLADVLKTTERPAATRYSELTELRNKMAADGSASGEMLGHIDHMLDIMGDIDYFRGEQQKAKEASALNSKEDLEALESELLDKSDKGILSEEDKAVLDNMPLYEMMVNLRQQQLDIDGGGAASIDAQIRNKQNAIKAYRAKMNELPKTDTAGRERYKALIEQVGGEIDDLFASRIVDQKAVNNGMRELIDDLVTLKEQGHSRLVEWSKGKQERSNGIRKLANDSFSSTARGYWDEVNKKGHRLRDINNFLNNAKLTVISPALSFEYMLGTLDKKYYTNDSPIYNRFIKSQDGLLKANDNFFEGLESYNKEVNEAANRLIGRGAITDMAEWFKLGDRFVTEEIPFAFEVDQMFDDGTVRKVTKGITATMTRGQAAKIYAWSRMADGMAKLKAHGVTDETIAAVKDFIGEGYMRFIDWVEDDFFPRLRREKYNPKYKEIYGISMAENEHYFPFAIYKKDVRTDTDLEQIGDDKLGGGLVGNLIERKRNNARLDFTRNSPDIFDMITRYGETMEEWTAYAQVREDLKAMVNDKQFKVKCDMFGTDYYKHFLEAARVASRTSDDKALAGKWNTSMSKLQKVLASGAISMRVSTALKQLLSAPAFAVYSLDPKFLHQLEKTVVPIDVESAIKGLWKIGSGDLAEAKKLLLSENWVGHYNWCVNNLPSFRERVSLGGAGNPILEEKGFFKLCDAVQSLGMIPNRLIDAYTCSVGAKAVYEYNFNKYKKMYGEKAAHNMAVTEAEIAFNSSQQSSNPVFLSPMQVSKQFLLRGLMNFKNSPIGYLRAGLKANIDIVRAIKSIYNPTFKVDGQEMRFNSNGKNAASMLMTAAARSAMYNFFLNFIWNLGTVGIAGLSYTAIRNLSGEGNEDGNLLYTDEEWKKATGDNLASTLFLCATQGLPYISGPFATAEQGTEFAPLMLLNTLNEMGTDIYKNGLVSPVTAQWIVNIALKYRSGIDPQVCAQVYEGLQGILADRPVTEEDIMNLLASPRSAISGMTKQKVGEFDRLRDYVDARIKSNREINIDERMDFGKALAGKRELRKSNLDYYIDEYLEANIPGYREISGRKSKETKQEEQANKKLYEQSMSLVEKIVSTPKGEADEQKSSKIDSEDYDTKYKVRKLRDAVAAIHKLYAAGDFGTAEDIAAEMQRRIERGYDPNGKTLDERLKNVDIWKPAVEVKQRTADGYSTNFDRAIGGVFKKMYVGKMNGEGN